MATFLANEINATERDVMGPTEQVQIMCSVEDKTRSNQRLISAFEVQ